MITTLVAIFKKEDRHTLEEDDMSIKETYLLLQKIISLPNVKLLAFILLTAKVFLFMIHQLFYSSYSYVFLQSSLCTRGFHVLVNTVTQ